MINEVIFDLETQKFFDEIGDRDPSALGVSVVSLYIRELDDELNELRGEIKSYWENDLKGLWPHFQKADRIIGFNSVRFDVPVLTPYANFPLNRLPHFDIMQQIKAALGHRLSLNALAKGSLNSEKTDVGARAVEYWKKGDEQSLKKLQSYCESDVVITKDIYDFGLKEKRLIYFDKWNTQREVEVDFAYPKEEKEEKQIGLF